MKIVKILVCLLFSGFALYMLSCNDEPENKTPVIIITEPFENQQFFVPDSIHLVADITDDRKITSLIVGLVDLDFIPQIPLMYVNPGIREYHLEIYLPIDQVDLETANYYLYIRAEDEEGFKNEYLKLLIVGVPRVLENIIILTYQGPFDLNVWAVDPDGEIEFLSEVHTDFSSSETDSKNRLLYITGINLTDINAFNLDTKQMEWQRDAFPPLPMHQPNCSYFDENLYLSYSTSFIYGFRYNGTMVFNTSIEENKLPSRLIKFEDFLIADLQSKTGGLRYLATYYMASGMEKQRMTIDYKVVDFSITEESNCLVIANSDKTGTLRLYDPYQNSENHLIDMTEKIISSEDINDSCYLLGTGSSVYCFNLNQNTLINIFPGLTGYRIRFDEINRNIYICGSHVISIATYPELQIQNTIPLQDSILNLHLFYNK